MFGNHHFNIYFHNIEKNENEIVEEIQLKFTTKKEIFKVVKTILPKDLANLSISFIDSSRDQQWFEYDLFFGRYEEQNYCCIVPIGDIGGESERTLGHFILFGDTIAKKLFNLKKFKEYFPHIEYLHCVCLREWNSLREIGENYIISNPLEYSEQWAMNGFIHQTNTGTYENNWDIESDFEIDTNF
jgi:hypothetical protein